MKGKLIITGLMLASTLLSACGSQPAAQVSTSTATLQQTPVLPATEATVTPAGATAEASVTPATPAVTASPLPTRPPNAADCTNGASFVADVTIPDNTEVPGGSNFTKTWRIMNTGTCIWASDYTLTFYSEERMNAPASVPLNVTYPGQTLDISVELTAPTSLGTHRGNFVIKNPAGLIMKINEDSRLWLIITVRNVAAATAAPTVTGGAVAQATGAPTSAASTSESGLGAATCSYSIDQARLTQVLNAVNAYRAQFGMSAYPVNPLLARAAQSHAADIACHQLFGHKGSDGSTIQSRIAASGYTASFSSENVYGSYPPLTPQEAVNWWINDKIDTNHRLNLISDTYTEIGIGYAFFNNYGYYVIVFATP